MLSDQTCTNPAGFHRRQQSTPSLPTLNQPLIPNQTDRQYSLQRRGTSLDRTSTGQIKEEKEQEDGIFKENNQRRRDERQQLQETQQPIARPGQGYTPQNESQGTYNGPKPTQHHDLDYSCLSASDINALLMDMHTVGDSPPKECADTLMDHVCSARTLTNEIDDLRGVNGANLDDSFSGQGATSGRNPLSSLTRPNFCQSDGLPQRPRTPEHQQKPSHGLRTPMTAPLAFRQEGSYTSHRRRPEASRKMDPNLTIKALQVMQRGRSPLDAGSGPLAPPETAILNRRSVDVAAMPSPIFPTMSELKTEMPTGEGGCNANICSPVINTLPATMSSFQCSPEASNISLFESAEVDSLVFDAQLSFMQATQGYPNLSGQSSPTHRSSHRRAQSVTDMDVEECVQNTGITAEEIASFIQGPFPDDQKWSCLFEEVPGQVCGKRFARKENAKSHVQTHLGDRQYVCQVCQTPFVRQHDLKRHFKIHTTEKPHRCPCGKDFHRHDALTRHRQRGMCSGAFDNSPKKTVKRGRPKKPRPTTEDRVEKAAKTRQLVMQRTRPGSTYASSISGSSEYSLPSPPSYDNVSVTSSSPSFSDEALGDFLFPNISSQPLTPPASPDRSSDGLLASPFMRSSYIPKRASKSASPELISIPEIDHISAHPARSNQEYQHNSPPELDLSSSSPATSNILDFSNFPDASDPQDNESQRLNCLNPQMLGGDFQPFDNTSKISQGNVRFEDFIDFGNLDPTYPEKQVQNAQMNGSGMKHGSFGSTTLNQLEDPFVDF